MIGTMPYPNVVQFSFPNRRELTMTMCRPQEFYESSHSEIKGQKFDWEKFLEVFSDDNGRLEYFSFWSGFNFPGNAFEKFLKVFEGDLSRRERRLAKEVFARVDRENPYYIIATLPSAEDTIRHELAHALFCVDSEYKKSCEEDVFNLPLEIREKMESGLTALGYSADVHVDEIQAYLSTGSPEELKKRFDLEWKNTSPAATPFRTRLQWKLENRPSGKKVDQES